MRVIENKPVFPASTLPEEGERVIYFFSPFQRWYIGTYSDNFVSGANGFTTWFPEVTMWMKGEENVD